MSVFAMAWAWEQECGSATEKLVLLSLADHANDQGYCYPSMKRVAEKTGFSRQTICTAVQSLEGQRLIKIEQRSQEGMKRSNLYCLQVPDVKRLYNDVKQADIPPAKPQSVDVKEPYNDVKEIDSRCQTDSTHDVKELYIEPYNLEPNNLGGGVVNRLKDLHLRVCGLATLPPLAKIRKLLEAGATAEEIEEVYVHHSGDVAKYRQRNINEALSRLIDEKTKEPEEEDLESFDEKAARWLREEQEEKARAEGA